MNQQRSGPPPRRRWSDLSAEEKIEIDWALYRGVPVGPEYVDLAADRAAAVSALVSPMAWVFSAITALAVVNVLFYSENGLSEWVFPAAVLVLSAGLHFVRWRYRKAKRINTRPDRESPPDRDLDHIVQLMRGSTRVEVALGALLMIVVTGLLVLS